MNLPSREENYKSQEEFQKALLAQARKIQGATSEDIENENTSSDFPKVDRVPSKCWALPSLFATCGLFGVRSPNRNRYYFKSKLIPMYQKDINMFYTGEELDQIDLDVFLELVLLCKKNGFGDTIFFKPKTLLKNISSTIGGNQSQQYQDSIRRLCATNLEIKYDNDPCYYGSSIIDRYQYDPNGFSIIEFNQDMFKLFKAICIINKEKRLALGKNQLSKWLYSFILRQRADGQYSYIKLSTIKNLTNLNIPDKEFRRKIKVCFEKIKYVDKELISDWEFKNDTIKFLRKQK